MVSPQVVDVVQADLRSVPEVEAPVNIASYIPKVAARLGDKRAIVFPHGRDANGRYAYTHLTFRQLEAETNRIARGLVKMGIGRDVRTVLMVKPSLEFIPLTFALFKVGAVPVLIDPGMGRKNLLSAVAEVKPTAFIGVSVAHAARTLFPSAFKSVDKLVTVGRKWWWGGATLDELRDNDGSAYELAPTKASDVAAILFTTGSTGPAKGVVYTHGIFDAQTQIIGEQWDVGPHDIDLPVFPLFALFSTALGATVVVPDMDPTKPAWVDASKMVEHIEDHGVTFSFGSPAFWNRVSQHCVERDVQLPSLKKVLMAGAPIPAALVERMQRVLPSDGDVHIPYGATECLPVSAVTGTKIRAGAGDRCRAGEGTCVGKPIRVNTVKIIAIDDGPIPTIDGIEDLGTSDIGEIIVRGPTATRSYLNRDDDTLLAKIHDGDVVWHRMGDVGYFDADGFLWYCGRKAHRVETGGETMFTVRCEAIFNEHPSVFRTALVGVGERGHQRPILCVECKDSCKPTTQAAIDQLKADLAALGSASPLTRSIDTFLFHPQFPVDIRHNAKIFREKLAVWAEGQLEGQREGQLRDQR